MVITASDFQNIELAIAAYVDEMYTREKRLTDTGIVTSDPRISADGESYIGQLRTYNTITPTFNTPSLSTATDGSFTDISTKVSTYIKGARSIGFDQVNLQQLVSQQDGFQKIARDMAELKAQDRQAVLRNILQGVAAYEAGVGAGGIANFSDVDTAANGFFVDINADGEFGAAATIQADERKLIDTSAAGAARGTRLFTAVGMAFGDYEPDYMYLVTSPEMMAELRAANLVDETVVTEGNIEFQTIFGGKFRLLLTRMATGDRSGDANVNLRSVKTTFVVKPGAIVWKEIPVPNPVEIDRDASTYFGGGNTELWHRWAHIMHPAGYSWAGATNAFAAATDYNAAAAWSRDADPLNLPILPIFHA